MNLIFYFTLLISSIICAKNKIFIKKINENVERDTFNLEITEDEKDIIVTMRSKHYFPIFATWCSGNDIIDSGLFYIEGVEIYDWMGENVTDKDSLDQIINNLEQHIFVFKINKVKFGTKIKDLKCLLELLKKDDYQKIMEEYWNDIELIDPANPLAGFSVYSEIHTKISIQKIYFGIEYSNKTNEMPNLNEFEIFKYDRTNEKESYSNLYLLKKCAIDVVAHSLLTVGFFGGIICAVRMSLLHYF